MTRYLPWLIMKKMSPDIHLHIRKMYAYCLEKRHFPSEWKIGNITIIPKSSGDKNRVASYRPVTLLPVMGKLFEKLIRNRIANLTKDIIPQYQFGFREGRSTTHPLTVLVSNVQ